MAKSSAKKSPGGDPKLSPGKGEELVGLVFLVVALLGGFSLLTHHPQDPSVLRHAEGMSVRNWIGPLGAHLSALGFGFIGLSIALVPVLLATAAWRRLRRRPALKIVGRGFGAGVVLAMLPALLQLTLGAVEWRGDELASGGFLGTLLSGFLERQIGFAGALFVLLGGVVIGFTLLLQSTLGELLAGWSTRFSGWGDAVRLALMRRRERQGRDQSRQRVVEKHLRRRLEERDQRTADKVREPPARVTVKTGEKPVAIRRVRGSTAPASSATPVAAPSRKGKPSRPQPQPTLPFEAAPGRRQLPPLNLLNLDPVEASVEENELVRLGEVIRSRCAEFGVEGVVDGISPGPIITVFEFQPAPGVKVSQIVNLQDDLALALKAESVRIDRIPGRSTLGIEVPNRKRALIRLGHLLSRERFQSSPSLLTMAIGTNLHGEPYYADLATMPHLLVAGATGSGKSVGLQSMITSIIYKADRDQVQFIFIDPKRIELGVYADIPHLKAEVVVEPKKASNALRWAVAEMERRYRLLAEVHVRSIDYYNRAIGDPAVQKRLSLGDEEVEDRLADFKPLPYYVIIIDELADLMMVSSSEVEFSIARLAQMARAVGIHLIVATQRPSVDVLTGTIKANFPCRMAFATATRHDSRTILDQVGSEKLLGKGDMLFMPPGTSRMMRLHGAYVTEQETAGLVRWLKKQGRPDLDPTVLQPPVDAKGGGGGSDADDELFDEAARMVVAEGQASASFLQRRLRVGFSRASRLVDMMERDGLLGPPQGSKPREVLVKADFFEEWEEARRTTEV